MAKLMTNEKSNISQRWLISIIHREFFYKVINSKCFNFLICQTELTTDPKESYEKKMR